MLRKELFDYYYIDQPEKKFVDTLKEKFVPLIPNELKTAGEKEKLFIGVYLDNVDDCFNDLDVAKNMFNDFLSANKISGNEYPVDVKFLPYTNEEKYYIKIKKDKCIVFARTTNGVRRALVRLEDELIANRGVLPLGNIAGDYDITRRITRCYFAPTNRPPLNGDELNDDVDYYPDNYLERLVRNGINGVWIYSDFEVLVESTIIPEFKGSKKRISKLNKVIEKCARYGIYVYLFLIEPVAHTDSKKQQSYPDILEKYSDMYGNSIDGEIAICTYTEKGRKYCEEACKKLFELAPKLKGIVHLSDGELITTCSSVWISQEWEWQNNCPHCGDKSRAEILVNTINIFNDSIKSVKPDAEYISWTYGHRMWQQAEINEYVDKIPNDVIMLQNFEDNGRAMQLGKKRALYDYWLSYSGPSQQFEETAGRAKTLNKEQWAKMQVCCSHEIASVPYIPVPGILYDKFMESKRLGVTGVFESWYFGNYPCLMQKAADVLSSNKKFSDKTDFLRYLATLYFNDQSIENVVKAWQCFEKGYSMYPYNILFSYYGPVHDGIVWELSLKPKNFSLPRSWFLTDKPDGDRIGECTFFGHTTSEVLELLENMSKYWSEGCGYYEKTIGNEEEIIIAKCLNVLIDSAKNIMEFYKLRNDIGYGRDDAKTNLYKMKLLVLKEIENCKEMIMYCNADDRIGYHSEAEGFKFFPEKIKSRIKQLKELLKTEFQEVERRILEGKTPIEYYYGEEDGVERYFVAESLEKAKWQILSDGKSFFKLADGEKDVLMQFKGEKNTDFLVCNEFELMYPGVLAIIKSNGEVKLHRDNMFLQSLVDEKIFEEKAKWRVENISSKNEVNLILRLNKDEVGFIRFPYKLMVKTMEGASWCTDPLPVYTLGKSKISPADYGWVIKE